MKLSEVISELAEIITDNGDIELDDDFIIRKQYGEIKIN